MSKSLKLNFIVKSYDTYPNGKLSMTSLLDFLQETAGIHAIKLNFGMEELSARNETWVLSRMRVEIDRWPERGEAIVVETWPKGVDRLFAVRDFLVYDKKGEIVARSSSYWLLVNKETKRPKPFESYISDQLKSDRSGIDQRLGKLPNLKTVDYSDKRKSMYSEIDENWHVNNVKYTEWIIDAMPYEILEERILRSYEINYLSEIKIGESIEIELGWEENDKNNLLGNVKKDDKLSCQVKMVFDN